MADKYKLVFSGEVLAGQHPAVVRKRLAASAGFADDALDKLFSGRPVVVKREADTAAAAKLQALFRKAGARLRVLPADGADDPARAARAEQPAATGDGPTRAPDRSASAEPTGEGEFELLPAGSDLLRETERTPLRRRDIDTGAMRLEGARSPTPVRAPEVAAPDVSHLSIAEVGSDLGVGKTTPEREVPAPDLGLADVGADLGPRRPPVTPVIDLTRVTFEVAPAGSELGQRQRGQAPAPPDTSGLSLTDPD